MPKPDLREPYSGLESDLIHTMTEGLHEWRGDLNYPESYSDWQGCVRALFRMYKIERRALSIREDDIVKEPDKCAWCGVVLGGEVCSGKNYKQVFCNDCGGRLRK